MKKCRVATCCNWGSVVWMWSLRIARHPKDVWVGWELGGSLSAWWGSREAWCWQRWFWGSIREEMLRWTFSVSPSGLLLLLLWPLLSVHLPVTSSPSLTSFVQFWPFLFLPASSLLLLPVLLVTSWYIASVSCCFCSDYFNSWLLGLPTNLYVIFLFFSPKSFISL